MAFVLLVEPDIPLAKTYQTALQVAGHEAVTAVTAQAAINQVDQRTPDIIILELQLPAHDGIEFLHELRSYPEWQTIPVVLNTYTAPSQLAAVRRVLSEDLGVRAMHYKPQTSLQLLLRSVAEQVESR
jgi:chemosensory pili system protein ChpA (sensor histidine kinase/response regulator)